MVCLALATSAFAKKTRGRRTAPLPGDDRLPHELRVVLSKQQLGRLITDKVLRVDLENPGLKNSYLLPFINPWAKPPELTFYLATSENVIFPLPDPRGQNRQWQFVKLIDRVCEDVNGDRFKDFLVVIEFKEERKPPFKAFAVFLNDQRQGFLLAQIPRVTGKTGFSKRTEFIAAAKKFYSGVAVTTPAPAEPAFKKFSLLINCRPEVLDGDLNIAACLEEVNDNTREVVVRVSEGTDLRFSVRVWTVKGKEAQPEYVGIEKIGGRDLLVSVEGKDCSQSQIFNLETGLLLADTKCEENRYCAIRKSAQPSDCEAIFECSNGKELKFNLCKKN